jgi:hypothetical protein
LGTDFIEEIDAELEARRAGGATDRSDGAAA